VNERPNHKIPHSKRPVSLTQELKEFLQAHPFEGRKLIRALVREGQNGNVRAIQACLDRIDGPVTNAPSNNVLPIRLVFQPAYDTTATIISEEEIKQLPPAEIYAREIEEKEEVVR
jgi:hypothetical protein